MSADRVVLKWSLCFVWVTYSGEGKAGRRLELQVVISSSGNWTATLPFSEIKEGRYSKSGVLHETQPQLWTDWFIPFPPFHIIAFYSITSSPKLSLFPQSFFQTAALNLFTWTSLATQQKSTSSMMYCNSFSVQFEFFSWQLTGSYAYTPPQFTTTGQRGKVWTRIS